MERFGLKLPNIYGKKNYKLTLAIPLILYVVFFFAIFVWPTVPLGIDFKGGTLIIMRADKAVDAAELKNLLSQNFELSDLKVTSVSGPTGSGVNIQFAENKPIAAAEAMAEIAKASLAAGNTAGALEGASRAVDLIKQFLAETSLPPDPALAVNQAELYIIEAEKNANEKMQNLIIEKFSLGQKVAFQLREVSPTLSASFWQTAINVAIFSLILVVIVIFLFFRRIVPSIAVIACGIFDVASAVALMAVFSMPMSLSTIPTLLMLLGYSIDTDIMLTSRMLQRREKTPAERAYDSMGTGLTMTGTTVAAVLVMLLVSYFNQIGVIFEISAVLLFGLIGDIIGTWLMNAPLLLWYVEKSRKVVA
ncbi:MAG: hypothetical protein NTW59_04725 [Candidatus Diapherotrites archaeon]|nr:hypothetical protein [Candidatus Diapherotrites archaeon]